MGQAKLPKAPTDLALGLEAKNAPTYTNIDIYIYIYIYIYREREREREMSLSYTWCNLIRVIPFLYHRFLLDLIVIDDYFSYH